MYIRALCKHENRVMERSMLHDGVGSVVIPQETVAISAGAVEDLIHEKLYSIFEVE